MNTETLHEFARHKLREDDLRRELKAEEGKRKKLEPKVREMLLEEGVPRVGLSDGVTVYVDRQLWANAPAVEAEGEEVRDYAAAVDALRRAGLEEYVQERFNVQSLSAYFRELERLIVEERREDGDEDPIVSTASLLERAGLREGEMDVSEKYTAKAIRG